MSSTEFQYDQGWVKENKDLVLQWNLGEGQRWRLEDKKSGKVGRLGDSVG